MHASEDDFNKILFERMGRGLEALSLAEDEYGASSPFHVRVSESNIVLEPKRSLLLLLIAKGTKGAAICW